MKKWKRNREKIFKSIRLKYVNPGTMRRERFLHCVRGKCPFGRGRMYIYFFGPRYRPLYTSYGDGGMNVIIGTADFAPYKGKFRSK